MKSLKIIAAKVEEILEFSKESEADDFCNMMKKVDKILNFLIMIITIGINIG